MKQVLLLSISVLLISSCVYENEEDAYHSTSANQKNSLDSGLIAHFCFQNSLIDSSKNNVSGTYNGTSVYKNDSPFGSGNKSISFNGTDNFFEIPVGVHDTITISMFFKGDGELGATVYPALLDYGKSALTLNLDAVTGGTALVLNNNTSYNMHDKNLCSYYNWVHIYAEFIISQKHAKVIATTKSYDTQEIAQIIMDPNITGDITLNNESIIIGHNIINTLKENYFKGMVDDIRIYNRILSEDELYLIYKVIQ